MPATGSFQAASSSPANRWRRRWRASCTRSSASGSAPSTPGRWNWWTIRTRSCGCTSARCSIGRASSRCAKARRWRGRCCRCAAGRCCPARCRCCAGLPPNETTAVRRTPNDPKLPCMNWLDAIQWDRDGLVPVIAQELGSNDVLMFAHMNREALQRTLESGHAVYWSRSRRKLWHKGEESGHVQQVHEIRMDCDNDVLLLKVTQLGHEPGIACHTGRHSCFFQRHEDGAWRSVEPVLKDPKSIYK